MASLLIPFFDVMDAEFKGKSWNARSLSATLDSLSAAEAASVATWEGYSAWSIALHCAKCKLLVAGDAGAEVPAWPFPADAWFPEPADSGEAAWARDRALLRSAHEACMAALRGFPEAGLKDEMPSWKAPWEQVIAWLVTHDSFHGAQIRSMGLPGLKEKKHE